MSVFPQDHEVCPVCKAVGSHTACVTAVEEAIAVKKLPASAATFNLNSPLEKIVHPLINVAAPGLIGNTIPALIEYYDTCMQCGTRFCIRQEVAPVPVQVQMQGAPQPPMRGR